MAAPVPQMRLANWLLGITRRIVDAVGLDRSMVPEKVLYIAIVVGLAFGAGWLVQKVLVAAMARVINRRFSEVGTELSRRKVLTKCGRVLPPLVLVSLIPFAFTPGDHAGRVLLSITLIYFIIAFIIAVNAVFGLVWDRYNTHHNARNLPLKGILDVSKGIMWILGVIVIVSIIVGKSPGALLAGIGVFASVLMLIFKDSILGLVAGVQLSLNDMLRVGDWIVVPQSDANGIVIDVSLIVVKIRNWNNTVSMVPPYTLVSKGFDNWRCMKDSGSRQIKTSIPIDINTVRPLTDDELHTIQQQVPALKEYIDIKLQQRSEGKTANVFNPAGVVNGTIDTNLGLLRAYFNLYVNTHPYIDTARLHMVRLLEPTPEGFPMQLFAYLTTADWSAYEAIMADIFEHITAIAPTFFLSVYEKPSGRSVYAVGESSKPGLPYYGTAPLTTATPQPETNKMPGK